MLFVELSVYSQCYYCDFIKNSFLLLFVFIIVKLKYKNYTVMLMVAFLFFSNFIRYLSRILLLWPDFVFRKYVYLANRKMQNIKFWCQNLCFLFVFNIKLKQVINGENLNWSFDCGEVESIEIWATFRQSLQNIQTFIIESKLRMSCKPRLSETLKNKSEAEICYSIKVHRKGTYICYNTCPK